MALNPSPLSSELPSARFAMGGAIYGELTPDAVRLNATMGFPGIEPYRSRIGGYLNRPNELKDVLDEQSIVMVTCSNGGAGQSCEFIDPARRQQTIDDHVAFARDFLAVFGCRHFKINMGARPRQGEDTTDDEIGALAETLNDLGRRTIDLGIYLAAHPHIWGPIERPREVHRLMELTDPRYVGLIVDTGQINLGGGDPIEMIDTYYDRIPALHFKDTSARFRGYTGPTPSIEQHNRENCYKDLGAGGVDFPSVWELLQHRGYASWITIDLDPPRPSEGEGSVEEKIAINRDYLLGTLRVGRL